jgi:UDP-N-acetylmuramate dehydrogenase
MNEAFYQELISILPASEVLLNEPMKNHTTFRIGGPAEFFIQPDQTQLVQALSLAKNYGVPVTIVGNGSNLLVGDGGIRGLVAEIGRGMSRISVDGHQIHAEAGALLARLANTAEQSGLGGLEFAAGIPGSVGGAVVMNAGAYDGEMKDVLCEATVLTPEGSILTLSKDELELSYRHSCILEKDYIVLSAVFLLEKRDKKLIRTRMEELRDRRIQKQPLEYPSAGSTFKRPEGFFAGKLIMDAGLRGYRVGDAQVSEKHCGFVINRGNATASDVLRLIEEVRHTVKERFGVELEPEVRMIGE